MSLLDATLEEVAGSVVHEVNVASSHAPGQQNSVRIFEQGNGTGMGAKEEVELGERVKKLLG